MRLPRKRTGYALLALAYALSAFLVLRQAHRRATTDRVTIRISQWQLETGVREAVDAVIKRYEEINPRVHVVQIAVPGGPLYVSWVLTQIAGGTAPDLVQYSLSDPDIPRIFQPITDEVMKPNPYNKGTPLEGVPWRDTFIDGMTSPDAYNESLHAYYSVALDTHFGRIVYNKPLFRKITGLDEPPADYRGFMAACARIHAYAAGHHLDLVPLGNSHDTNTLQAWLISCAMALKFGRSLDFEHRISPYPDEIARSFLRGEWTLDDPNVAATFKVLKEYGDLCNPGFWQRERDTAVTDFVSERSVMMVAPSWEATNLLSLCHFELGVFRYPTPSEKDPEYGRFILAPVSEGGVITGFPIYLNRTTPHRAEAIDFMHFITSQEGSSIFTKVSNWPPATRGVSPSPFAARFKLEFLGYCSAVNFLVPTSGYDAAGYVMSRMSDLWGSDGSVAAFTQGLKSGHLDDWVRGDLRLIRISSLDNLRRNDAIAAARLETGAARRGILDVTPALLEQTAYENGLILATPGRTPGPPDLESPPFPSTRSARAAGTSPAARPGLAAAWGQLLTFHPETALGMFAGMSGPESAVTRAARLGQAISLLDKQPVSDAQIGQARALLASVADGDDDAALGAQFFLGRIAQHHQQAPDPVEAARWYSRLVTGHPASIWAQTALPRLALLELYAFDGRLAPLARLRKAEGLLSLARTPDAAVDLHLLLAYACYFYRLPDELALTHLVEAERLGISDPPTRRETLVEIGEIAVKQGRRDMAERYLGAFLRENPIDVRGFTARRQLEAMGAKGT
jgi:ABC-type glycerol-3-phosphate transport system substrate-binding protein